MLNTLEFRNHPTAEKKCSKKLRSSPIVQFQNPRTSSLSSGNWSRLSIKGDSEPWDFNFESNHLVSFLVLQTVQCHDKKTLESSSFQTFHPHRVLLTHFISLKPPSHLQVIMSSPVLIQLHWPQEPVQFPHMVSVLPTPGRRRYSGGGNSAAAALSRRRKWRGLPQSRLRPSDDGSRREPMIRIVISLRWRCRDA